MTVGSHALPKPIPAAAVSRPPATSLPINHVWSLLALQPFSFPNGATCTTARCRRPHSFPRCRLQVSTSLRLERGTASMNMFLNQWLDELGNQQSISVSAKEVATALARFVGIGRLAFANSQKLNIALGRDRMDKGVLGEIRELQEAGYLGRFQGNRYNQSRGWALMLPEWDVAA